MANLVLSFAELLAGAILIDAAVKGDSIPNVVKGVATQGGTTSSTTAAGGTGTTPATGTGGAVGLTYTNPVPGATTGRVDQGVDYALGKAGFLAPGRSRIVYTGSGGGWGNEYVAGELLDGPLAGQVWYIAEAAATAPGIAVGKIVNAGQQIAPQGSSTGGAIEAGWANPSDPGQTLAQSMTGYSGDQSAQALKSGYSFSTFVSALGGISGVFEGAGQALAGAIEQAFSTGMEAGVPFG